MFVSSVQKVSVTVSLWRSYHGRTLQTNTIRLFQLFALERSTTLRSTTIRSQETISS
ncbi:unnamed protein product [Ixodes persulcatus]